MDHGDDPGQKSDNAGAHRASSSRSRPHQTIRGLKKFPIVNQSGDDGLDRRIKEGAQSSDRKCDPNQNPQIEGKKLDPHDRDQNEKSSDQIHADHRPSRIPMVCPDATDQTDAKNSRSLSCYQKACIASDHFDRKPNERDFVNLVADCREGFTDPENENRRMSKGSK